MSWNYTTWLNIVFLLLAAVLVLRFFRTGGIADAAHDGRRPDPDHDHGGTTTGLATTGRTTARRTTEGIST